MHFGEPLSLQILPGDQMSPGFDRQFAFIVNYL